MLDGVIRINVLSPNMLEDPNLDVGASRSNGALKTVARRRFVRGVGVALPVALSVSAKSALACHCTSVSAHSSIKLANSHNATTDVNSTAGCNGWSPDTWKGLSKRTYGGLKTVFSSVFNNDITGQDNMKQVLNGTYSEEYKYFAAAYLNAFHSRVNARFYKVTDMQAMWPVVKFGSGEYSSVPNIPAGKGWNKQDILDYFRLTWP